MFEHPYRRPAGRRLAPVPPRDGAYGDGCDGDAKPGVDTRGADDERGTDDDDAEKPKGVSLGAQRAAHG
jgi:hypothetical protein